MQWAYGGELCNGLMGVNCVVGLRSVMGLQAIGLTEHIVTKSCLGKICEND